MRLPHFVAIVVIALAAPLRAAPLYRVTDLHTDGGFDLTDDGAVYVKGYAADARTPVYSVVRGGKATPLNVPAGSNIIDVSGRGTLLGETPRHADFVQFAGGARRYLTPAAGARSTHVYAVNDAGVAAGVAAYGTVNSLVLWKDAKPILPHVAVNGVWAINRDGVVAVTRSVGEKRNAVGTVRGSTYTALPMSAARPVDFATDISAAGTVVGIGFPPGLGDVRALVWKGGKLTEPGVLAGDTSSGLNAINDGGLAVGGSTGSGVGHAVLWDGRRLLNLNSLITGARGVTLNEGVEINANGQILAYGHVNGRLSSFLLTPTTAAKATDVASIPEPATAALFLAATALLRRRR